MAVLIWSKTDCSVSVVAMVICLPLTVKVPAVTALAKPALPSVSAETSFVALNGAPAFATPCRLAAVASWRKLKA